MWFIAGLVEWIMVILLVYVIYAGLYFLLTIHFI